MKKIFTALLLLLYFVGSGIAQPTKLTENFDKVKDLKALKALGWQTYQGNATLEYTVSSDKANSHTSSKFAYITCKKAGVVYKRDNWLITPQLTVEAGTIFSFWAKSKLPSPADDNLKEDFNVKVSKTGTSPADFTITLQEVRSVLGEYTRYSYSITEAPVNLLPGDKIYLAIQSVDFEDEGNSALCIDDVFFGFPTPALSLNKTAWETPCYLGESNSSGKIFTITNTGEGTLSIASVTGLEGTPFTTSINPAEVNLGAFQSYSFSVDYAGAASGIQDAILTITTTDGQSSTIALKGTTSNGPAAVSSIDEDFENGLSALWSVVDGNNNGTSWKVSSKSVDNVDPSLKSLICEQAVADQNEWLITPKIKVVNNQMLSFMAKTQFDNPADVINIRVSKTGRNFEKDFSVSLAPITIPNEWAEMSFMVSDFPGIVENDEVYVAIQVVSPGVQAGKVPGKLTLDNFKVYTPVILSSEKKIVGSIVDKQVGETVIDADNHTVAIVMPFGTDLKAIAPAFTLSPKSSIDPTTAQDFSSKAVAYTVTAEDKSTQVWSVSIICQPGSKEAEILTFKVDDKDAVIDAAKATVNIEVAASADLTTIIPVISVSSLATVSPASGVATDFSKGAVAYTVTAQDGTPKVWQVTVTKQVVLSSEKKIVSCSVDKQVGETVINADNHTVAVVLPFGTDLKAIAPVFALSPQATIDPTVAQDFSSNAVSYTVTAEDKSTQVWSVSITCQAGSKEAEILTFKVDGKDAAIDAAKATVTIELDADANLTSVKPIFTVSSLATVSPASDVATDFSKGAVTYTVTAQDGTKKDWLVTVTKIVIPALEGLFEGFEDGLIPESWKAIDADGNGKSWKVIGNAKFEGKYGVKTYSNKTGNNDWLVTPKVKVRAGDILSFMYRSASENTKESFNVKISKTGRDVADFGITLSEMKEASAEYGFTKYEYKLTDKEDIKVGDEIYIAIQVVSVSCMELHVDNVSVAPAPVVPKAEVNKNYWRSVCKVDATQTSEKTFILTNTLAGILNVTSITLPEGFSTSIDKGVVALAPGESYAFSIAFAPTKEGVHCGDLVVETNGGNVLLALSGYGVAKAAYHESFETEASYAEWETLDNDGDGNNWFPYQNTDQAPDLAHSGSTCIVSESAILKGGPATPDNWLITPRLVVGTGQKMTFWVGAVSDISFKECYSVKISTTDKTLSSFTTLVDKSVLTTNGWSMVEVDLATYAGKNVYIAVEHHNVSDESQIIFDDFILPSIYEAATPDLNISVARLENTQIPLAQADFRFKVKVKNRGAELKDKATVKFRSSESNVIENQDLVGPLAKDSEVILESKVAYTPATTGNYEFAFEAVLANDDNQADNVVKLPVAVTDSVLAKDNGTFDNFIGLGKVMSGVIGQRFALNKKATITSVSFFIVAPKEPTEIVAGLYAFNDAPKDLLAESNTITVSEEGWYTVKLNKPVTLEKGNIFIGLKEGVAQSLNLGINQNIPASDNCFIYLDGTWIKAEDLDKSLNVTLMVRGNFGKEGTTGIDETVVANASVYPNPATDMFALKNVNNATVQIFNMAGIQCLSVSNVFDNEQINISSLMKGVYIVKIISASGQKSQIIKLMVE